MKEKAFTLIEISIITFIIILTAYLVIPNIFNDSKQTTVITQWKYSYRNIEYMFSAIKAQTKSLNEIYANNKSNSEKEELFFELLKPFMRNKTDVSTAEYKTYFYDSKPVTSNDDYSFSQLHLTNSNTIIGIKWLNNDKNDVSKPVAMMLYDINGLDAPNKWGTDIFGVNIYKDKIEPFGKGLPENLLKKNCSPSGNGVYCAYYYYIYGGIIHN